MNKILIPTLFASVFVKNWISIAELDDKLERNLKQSFERYYMNVLCNFIIIPPISRQLTLYVIGLFNHDGNGMEWQQNGNGNSENRSFCKKLKH